MEKMKVKRATREEANFHGAMAAMKLESASVGQLQSAICSLAESFIQVTADCPDIDTLRGLAAALVAETLDENAGETSLQDKLSLEDMKPFSTSTN